MWPTASVSMDVKACVVSIQELGQFVLETTRQPFLVFNPICGTELGFFNLQLTVQLSSSYLPQKIQSCVR